MNYSDRETPFRSGPSLAALGLMVACFATSCGQSPEAPTNADATPPKKTDVAANPAPSPVAPADAKRAPANLVTTTPPATAASASPAKDSPKPPAPARITTEWTSLFDGKTLAGWKVTQFGGEGDVEIKNGDLLLGIGEDMTGVTITRPIPLTNYEVQLEARRVDGSDFFCGLTFPVKKDPCSLILGGWGGGVCGLSSIDGHDASENSTTKYREFEKGRWYAIRLVVTDDKIEAWIDKDQIVDQELKGREISIRSEVEASKPFGFATWRTVGALRNIKMRLLK